MVGPRNFLILGSFALTLSGCTVSPPDLDPSVVDILADTAAIFIEEHEARIQPLETELGLAWWKANTTGKKEDFEAKEKIQNRLNSALSDPKTFEKLKTLKEVLGSSPAGQEKYPLILRQLDVLYLQYLAKQLDPELLKEMTALENTVEKAFSTYRAEVDGKKIADSEVRKVLKESKDSSYRKKVWEASKGVGALVEADLKKLLKLRNQAARKLGFRDFHQMNLELSELKQEEVRKLFDELHQLTREPFRAVKAEIDARLVKDYGIPAAELRPWHYHDPFFQEAPGLSEVDFDSLYAEADIPKLCSEFYTGIGLPVDSVLAASDLFEKEGKNPHAFCTDIDRQGDVRVLANIVPSEYWMATLLHELGHAVYSSTYIPRSVPYVLRENAHILTTEGIAMMFEKFSKSADWIRAMGIQVNDPEAINRAGARLRRFQLLIFAAWSQVMFRFEMEMYRNPDQDLNKLWWDLVELYQLVNRPPERSAPDYAAKIHVVIAPAYYHNYLMGQLFASQVHEAIARQVLEEDPARALYNGKEAVGRFLKEKIFSPGRSVHWSDLTRQATGKELDARAFAAEFEGN